MRFRQEIQVLLRKKSVIPKGFLLSAIDANIDGSSTPKEDMGLIYCEDLATICGLFTKNRIKAAPVLIGMELVKKGSIRAIIANSGSANACTGAEGLKDARSIMGMVASLLGIKHDEVIPLSTGVIGTRLPVDRMSLKIGALLDGLGLNVQSFARSIMTTDTFPKVSSVKTDGATILGIAKGAGMIAPDMATTLAIVITDAKLDRPVLLQTVEDAVNESFNTITVDGDTSTNDTLLAVTSNRIDASPNKVREGIRHVIKELAMMVISDGEGATKLISIDIHGCNTDDDAKTIGFSVANSILVKTAFFGSDPNWGRIMAAIAYSGVAVDARSISISISGYGIVEGGIESAGFREGDLKNVLGEKEISVDIKVGPGPGRFRVWTTDLSHKYIDINAGYRT